MSTHFAASYAGKNVAITGASGYLAHAILSALASCPARVLRISRQSLGDVPGIDSMRADVRERACWNDIVSFADVIFHLAGNTSVHAAMEDPAESLISIVHPVLHMAAAARRAGRKPRVVLAGTVTQYGITAQLPVSEDTRCHPITNYDLHKQFAENQLLLATRQALLDGVCLRLANVFGPSASQSSARDRGVINKVAQAALSGQPLQLYGGGLYLRDYVYIDDVAQAFLASGIAERAVGRAFNVAGGRGTTVRDAFRTVARSAERLTGRRASIKEVPWPPQSDPIEHRNFVADIRALKAAANWEPAVTFEEGIDRMIGSMLVSSPARS